MIHPPAGRWCLRVTPQLTEPRTAVSDLVLPWQTPAATAIFSTDRRLLEADLAIPSLIMRRMPPDVPVQVSTKGGKPLMRERRKGGEGKLCDQAFQPLRDEDDGNKRERVLRQATQKWLLIVKRHACEMGIIPPEEDELVACFGTRSVYTILKRANNFLAFLRWADVMPENSAKVFVDRDYLVRPQRTSLPIRANPLRWANTAAPAPAQARQAVRLIKCINAAVHKSRACWSVSLSQSKGNKRRGRKFCLHSNSAAGASLCRACHAFCILGSRLQQRAYRARGFLRIL